MADDRYEKTYWKGHLFDRWTAAALEEWEDRSGVSLYVYQGSYRPYSPNSSSTHQGGGAVDLWAYGIDADLLTNIGRRVGFAAWWRTPSMGPWPHHIHGILIGNEKADPLAKSQVANYKKRGNGLSGWGPDTFQPWRPDPIPTFNYKGDDPVTKEEVERIANQVANEVWDRKIKNPLTPGDESDKMDLSFAINRLLLMTNQLEKDVAAIKAKV